ncbi:trypsin-like serine protease [Phragmitibacter flavus]|uniref:Trypsin-like serine protease n=1 Tax=Phragmitibacter flavus TaxID=2576071 RepID=A0A5R8KCQ7_9BACT|nr:transglutaminase family protein [Phragmitibacter flavus]TLD69379.1 trypsin-like serine protease [Phragmitibacter flavus]
MRLFVLVLIATATAIAISLPHPGKARENDPPSKRTLSIENITQTARASIVTVTQFGRGGQQEALGTGFVISPDGLIATNSHVIGNARRLQVQTSDGLRHDVTEIHATDASLDLAIIKIAKTGLTPLPLGDSDRLKQGQRILALGNPQGLTYSVVEGVLSAVREVESSPMLQLAIPIEEGNSGGPVLDRQGKVQGIITLKSAITDNLGFAHPVNQLKLLIDRPNPVPMTRWLTIGKLNPSLWQPTLGALWTQHAGQIHVEGPGDGFGGRSNLLHQTTPPAIPYELSVDVKLDSESGAAALIFCPEGTDQHSGFSPTAGKLRLTRFNGPDLFSWTILADETSPAYIPGTWNTLRVRVEADNLLCYVNDQLVIQFTDNHLRGGKVGLCKFRNTKAAYKNFQLGTTLAPTNPVSPEILTDLQSEIQKLLTQKEIDKAPSEKLLTTPAAARRLLQQQTKTLEQQAAALRVLEKNLHRQDITRQLVDHLKKPDDQVELLSAALLIASHDNPDIDIRAPQQTVQQMVDELRNDPALQKDPQTAARRLSDYLFRENGFHGTRGDAINELSNSYLNEVIDDREGIPLTLSIVYLELVRQLKLQDIHGANLPGRFMIFYQDVDGPQYVDVFNNGTHLDREELETFIRSSTGQQPTPEHLAAATPRDMILRLLYNLVSFCEVPEQSIPYLDLILAIDPNSTAERLNRALLRSRIGDSNGAREDLDFLKKLAPAGVDLQKLDAIYNSF